MKCNEEMICESKYFNLWSLEFSLLQFLSPFTVLKNDSGMSVRRESFSSHRKSKSRRCCQSNLGVMHYIEKNAYYALC